MSHIAPPTLEDQTRALHGVDAIAAYLGINHVLTQLFLETETLRGTKTDDGWTAKPADLNRYRDTLRHDRRRQYRRVAISPAGFPRSASFV